MSGGLPDVREAGLAEHGRHPPIEGLDMRRPTIHAALVAAVAASLAATALPAQAAVIKAESFGQNGWAKAT